MSIIGYEIEQVWRCSDGEIFLSKDDARLHARWMAVEDILRAGLDEEGRLTDLKGTARTITQDWWED